MVVHSSLIDNGTLVSQGLVVSSNHMASTGCKGLSVDASIQFMHHQFSSFVLATKRWFLLDTNTAPCLDYWNTMAKISSWVLLCLFKMHNKDTKEICGNCIYKCYHMRMNTLI